MKARIVLAVCILFCSAAGGVLAAESAGGLDPAYRPTLDGAVGVIVPSAEGRTFIGGAFRTVNGMARSGVACLLADGSVDKGFDPGGGAAGPADSSVNAFLVLPDAKVLVGGSFTEFAGRALTNLVRLLPDGSVDETFVPPALASPVRCLARQPDGRILHGGVNQFGRLLATGEMDSSFAPPLLYGYQHVMTVISPSVDRVAVLSTGQVLIQGYFRRVGSPDGDVYYGLARLEADGSLDSTFVSPSSAPETGDITGPTPAIACMTLQSDGKPLVGCGAGYFASWSQRLARLDANGVWDPSFHASIPTSGNFSPANEISAILAQTDGRVLVSGEFETVGGATRVRLARLLSNGELDLGFDAGAGLDAPAAVLAVDTEGNYLVGGSFTNVGGVAQAYLARLKANVGTGGSPVVLTAPADHAALQGEEVRLRVAAEGSDLQYQWRFGGNELSDATNSTLALTNIQPARAGDYTVLVRNGEGQAESGPARVTVETIGSVLNAPSMAFTSQYGLWMRATTLPWATVLPGPGWFIQTGEAHDGGTALRTKPFDPTLAPGYPQSFERRSAEALLQTSVEGPGLLSFLWKHGGTGILAFRAAGVAMLNLPASPDASTSAWRRVGIPLPTGTHDLAWWCAIDAGEAWLDELTFTPGDFGPAAVLRDVSQSAETGFRATLTAPANAVIGVEWSADLLSWQPLSGLRNLPDGAIEITDPDAANRPQTFYRTSAPAWVF